MRTKKKKKNFNSPQWATNLNDEKKQKKKNKIAFKKKN